MGLFAGCLPRFDLFVRAWIADDIGLKGDLAMAVVWWAWFRREEDVRRRRATVLAAVIATAAAVVLGRALGHLLPFRMRPYSDPTLGLHWPAGGSIAALRVWSSFPSDHAMVWAAIAVGIGAVSLRAGLFLGFVGFFTVCLPRVYVGLHFATDVLAGWIIGMLMGWLLTRPRIRDRLAAPFLRWEAANPGLFYAAAFMATLHLAAMFWNIRQLAGRLLHAS